MPDQTYLEIAARPERKLNVDMAHLLRRAGFGANPETIRSCIQSGVSQTTHSLLHPELGPDDPGDTEMINRLTDLVPEKKAGQIPVQFVKIWWVHRMLTTRHPLREKMTLFWHGHFTSKLGDGQAMLGQNQMFRQNALGNFRTLVQAVSRDPAMLKYLNGNQNFKAHPNENYARELMELFTCGIGNYTEDDVKAAARAFSGWNLRGDQFFFNPRRHDDDVKTFLGKSGAWNGMDIVDMLVAHPATARRLSTQLFSFFAYPNPEKAEIDPLVKTYYSSGYDIGAMVGQILHSKAFYSDKARNAIIKSPVEYVIGSIKMLGIEDVFDARPEDVPLPDMSASTPAFGDSPSLLRRGAGGGSESLGKNEAGGGAFGSARMNVRQMLGPKVGRLTMLTIAMRSMGQDLLAPPSVKGWDGGEAWINSATLLSRVNFANRLAQNRVLYSYLEAKVNDYTGRANNSHLSAFDTSPFAGGGAEAAITQQDPVGWVNYLCETLGPLHLTQSVRNTLLEYAQHGEGRYQDKMLALLPLIMATPEYMVG